MITMMIANPVWHLSVLQALCPIYDNLFCYSQQSYDVHTIMIPDLKVFTKISKIYDIPMIVFC